MAYRASAHSRRPWFRIARAGALLALLVSVAVDVEARGGRGGGGGFRGGGFGGGGIRGGGSTSIGRGGDFGRGSYDRGSDSYRSGSTFSREGNYSRPSRLDNQRSTLDGGGSRLDSSTRPSGGNSATQLPANTRPGGIGGSGSQLPANRPGGGHASQLPVYGPERPQRPGEGPGYRPDCPKCSDGWDGWVDHPIAAGVVIGAVAGYYATLGSYWYSLPAHCSPYWWESYYYYSCDGIWYEPGYHGDTIVYVTVPDPTNGQVKPTK